MKRFNCNTVKPSSHLAETPLKTQAANRRAYKQALEWADGVKVERCREYLAPVKAGFVPRAFGRKTKGLSPAKRELLERKAQARREFFAELGVTV
jgi:hypothetical protein